MARGGSDAWDKFPWRVGCVATEQSRAGQGRAWQVWPHYQNTDVGHRGSCEKYVILFLAFLHFIQVLYSSTPANISEAVVFQQLISFLLPEAHGPD
jgi:hypothetical protein